MLKNINFFLILSVCFCFELKSAQKESDNTAISRTYHKNNCKRKVLTKPDPQNINEIFCQIMPQDLINIIADYASSYRDEYERLLTAFNSNKKVEFEAQKKLQEITYNEVKALRENLKKIRPGFENLLNDVINLELEMLFDFYFKKNFFGVLIDLDDIFEKIKEDSKIPDLELFNVISQLFTENRFKLTPDSELYWTFSERVNRFCLFLILKDNDPILLNDALKLSYKVMCYSSPNIFAGEHFRDLDDTKYLDLDVAVAKKILNIDFVWLVDLLKKKYDLI